VQSLYRLRKNSKECNRRENEELEGRAKGAGDIEGESGGGEVLQGLQ
jgi:hypothetical protein